MADFAAIAHVLTIIATAPPAIKVIESDAWSNPRTWLVVVFLLLIATWREWFGALKSLFVAKRTSQITEEGKDKDQDRTLETTLFKHALDKETKAQDRAEALANQTIETLQSAVNRQAQELIDIRAERDQAQVDLKVEIHNHNDTRADRDRYRQQRNNLRHMLAQAKHNIDRDLGDAFSMEIDQMLELADEASSVQTLRDTPAPKVTGPRLPSPPGGDHD